MSKGNLFLGFGRGKVGDVVFYRQDGEQIARARNRSPRNPRTAIQLVQRVIMKTVSQAYSILQPICDHSFEGLPVGTANQSRFVRLNTADMRALLSDEISFGDDSVIFASEATNFAGREETSALFNDYIVSDGTLPRVNLTWNNATFNLVGDNDATTETNITYGAFINSWGFQRGDQLTFLWLYGDDTLSVGRRGQILGFEYSRLILEPSDGNLVDNLFASSGGGLINRPNSKNEGRLQGKLNPTGTLSFWPAGSGYGLAGNANIIMGMAVITSRRVGNSWLRSPARIVFRSDFEYDPNIYYLGDAVRSFRDQVNSSLYLNQPEPVVTP